MSARKGLLCFLVGALYLALLFYTLVARAGGGYADEPPQQMIQKKIVVVPPDDGWTWPELLTAVGAAGTGVGALVVAVRRKRKP